MRLLEAVAFCFCWLAQVIYSQSKVKWLADLPTGHILSKGDILKIPLDDYVDMKGAQFDTDNALTRPFIEQNLRQLGDLALDSYIEPINCGNLLVDGNDAYLICSSRYVVKVSMDTALRKAVSVQSEMLVTSVINQGNQKCFDVFIYDKTLYINCWDKVAKGKAVIHMVNFGPSSVTRRTNECNTPFTTGDSLRMNRLLSSTINPSELTIGLFVGTGATADTTPRFVRCRLSLTSNETVGFGAYTVDINNILIDSSQVLVKSVNSISPTEVLITMSYNVNNYKELRFAVFNMDVNGMFSKSKFNVKGWYPGSLPATFDPAKLSVDVDITSIGTYVTAADMKQVYRFTLTYQKINITNHWIDAGATSITLAECGFSQASNLYIGKVTTLSRHPLQPGQDRTFIEYRSTSTQDLFSYAVIFNGGKYACSTSSGVLDGSVYSVGMLNINTVLVSQNNKITFLRLQRDSFIKVKTDALTSGAIEINIDAKLPNYSNERRTLKFTLTDTSKDWNKFDLPTKTMTAFSDSKVELPVASADFQCNNPTFTFSETNIKVYHTETLNAQTNIDLSGGYSISSLISIDATSFLAVLKGPGVPDKVATLFPNITGSSLVWNLSSTPPQMPNGVTVFKSIKLGGSIFCLFFKPTLIGSPKLSITCLEDKSGGRTLLKYQTITNDYEIDDLQYAESSERVDIFMVGTSFENGKFVRKVLHYFIQLNTDGTVGTATDIRPLDIMHLSLSSFYPTDLMVDYLATDEVPYSLYVKMLQEGGLPVIAKFGVSYEGNVAVLAYKSMMHLENRDISFCVCKEEIIMYNKRLRRLYAQPFYSGAGIPAYDQYLFPLKDYPVSDVLQLVCIPEKSMFQVLALKQDSSKVVMTFRGGESKIHPRRVHSVVNVPATTDFIDYGLSARYIITVASSPGDNTVQRPLIFTYTNSPDIYIDNTGKTADYSFTISMNSGASTATETIQVKIVKPTLAPTGSAKGEKIEFSIGKMASLENLINIGGALSDVSVSGNPAPTGISLVKRSNFHRGFATGEVAHPDKLLVEKDFLASMNLRSSLKIYGDPTVALAGSINPLLIMELKGSIRDIAMVRHGLHDQAVVVYKMFNNGRYEFGLVLVTKITEYGMRSVYKTNHYPRLFTSREDYEDMQAISVNGGDVSVALSSQSQISNNFIKLLNFRRSPATNSYVLATNANLVFKTDRPLTSYSFVYVGGMRSAIFATVTGALGFQVAIWDGYSSGVTLVNSTTKFDLGNGVSELSLLNKIRCFPIEEWKIECFAETANVNHFLFAVAVNKNYESSATTEYITSVTKIGEIEIPPQFTTTKVSKGKEFYGLLLKKTDASNIFPRTRRVLQGITMESYSTCANIILTYKPKISKFSYAAITCSNWHNTPNIDFDLEEIGGRDFVFFGRPKAPKPPTSTNSRRALQIADNQRIIAHYLSTPMILLANTNFDPANAFIDLIGLNGKDSTDKVSIAMSNFKADTPPAPVPEQSSWLKYLIIFLIAVAVIAIIGVAGVFAYEKLGMGNSSSSSGYKASTDPADTSKANEVKPNESDNLDDTRL